MLTHFLYTNLWVRDGSPFRAAQRNERKNGKILLFSKKKMNATRCAPWLIFCVFWREDKSSQNKNHNVVSLSLRGGPLRFRIRIMFWEGEKLTVGVIIAL